MMKMGGPMSLAPQPSPAPKTLTPEQLDQALYAALQNGPTALDQQLRCVLGYSQMQADPLAQTTYQPPTLNAAQARFAALVSMADFIPAEQVLRLYRGMAVITDLRVRVDLQSRLLLRLPASDMTQVMQDLWASLERINHAVTRMVVLGRLAQAAQQPSDDMSPSGDLSDIIRVAQMMKNDEARVRSLAALAVHAPAETAEPLYKHVLETLSLLSDDSLKRTTLSSMAVKFPQSMEALMIEAARAIPTPTARAGALTALVQVMPDRDTLKQEALAAIESIAEEEEQAEALVQIAPYLGAAHAQSRGAAQGLRTDSTVPASDPYTETLQSALAIAISMHKRTLRAQALVALSPHMTVDLQGETLAAVHSLPNERDRAQMLGELAPHLPANMLIASLAVAHTMRQQDARVYALSVLAHYIPERAREQTMLDALAAASNLPSQAERVRSLLELADILPPTLQSQAFTNALEATRLIDNENARARALSQLGHHLPPTLIGRALEAAYELHDPQQRLNTLTSLAPHLSGESKRQAVAHMLENARLMPFEYRRAQSLVSIAPFLTPDLMNDAFQIARGISDPYDRVTAYIALAQALPLDQRPQVLSQAWKTLRQIESGYDRANAIAAIAPVLPEALHDELQHIALSVVQAVDDDYDRASAISLLAPILGEDLPGEHSDTLPDAVTLLQQALTAALTIAYPHERHHQLQQLTPLWLTLEPTEQFTLWQAITHYLKTLPLADVLLCLGEIMPVLRQLSGESNFPKVAQVLGFKLS